MKQRGIALIAGLVLLAAISLLGLMAASGMILQKHMASNFRQDMLALENSEMAGSYASKWLFSRRIMNVRQLVSRTAHFRLQSGMRVKSRRWLNIKALPGGVPMV